MFRKMFLFLFCLVIGSMLVVPAMGQMSSEQLVDMAIDSAGNVYMAGNVSVPTNGFLTVKYDSDGNLVWNHTYQQFSGNGGCSVQSIAVTPSGEITVTGYDADSSSGTWDYDAVTLRYTSDGNLTWAARYHETMGGLNRFTAVDVASDSSGNAYVTGYSFSGSGDFPEDYCTIKYDSSGTEKWVARYNGPGNSMDEPAVVVVDSQDNVYVTGLVAMTPSGSVNAYGTIKYDSDGNQRWAALYVGPGNYANQATALVIDDAGNAYVTGMSSGSGTGIDYATVKYDADGNQLWAARYTGPAYSDFWGDRAAGIALGPDGTVYVTGSSAPYSNGYDLATVKYDADGNQLWAARYGNAQASPWAQTSAIVVDASGNAYVTGRSSPTGSRRYITIKYSADGNQLWSDLYSGSADWSAEPNGIAIDAYGNIYVAGTGSAGSPKGSDFAALKYGPLGDRIWEVRYDQTLNQPPVANAGTDEAIVDNVCPLGTAQVILNGSGSTDPDNNISSYAWTEGVVPLASGVSAEVSLSAGTHTITLTVTDLGSLISTDQVVITVSACDPVVMISELISEVAKNGLTAKLESALDAYVSAKGSDYIAAINKMESFINQCNADSLLDSAKRTELVNKAQCVIDCIHSK